MDQESVRPKIHAPADWLRAFRPRQIRQGQQPNAPRFRPHKNPWNSTKKNAHQNVRWMTKKQKFVSLSECNHFWVCYLRIDGENVCKPPFIAGWWLQPCKRKRCYLVIGKIIIRFLWFELYICNWNNPSVINPLMTHVCWKSSIRGGWTSEPPTSLPSLRERFPATMSTMMVNTIY